MLLLTLTAGTNQYAVDAARVIEVVPKVELRTVPHGPAALAGFLGYRGHVLPVLDLSLLLANTPSRDCLSTRIILVDARPSDHSEQDHDSAAVRDDAETARPTRKPAATPLGLIAERVTDLAYVQPDQIVPSPIVLPNAPYLGAIIQMEQAMVQLILVEQLREVALLSSGLDQASALDLKRSPSPSTA
jgi:chemotaxis-related protein WspB